MSKELAWIIETIPDPQDIRHQLALNLRQRKILRRLRKVSEYTAKAVMEIAELEDRDQAS